MKVVCAYYANSKRMSFVIEKISLNKDICIRPVRGMMVRTPKTIKFIGDIQECMVGSRSGEDTILFTNNPLYANFNNSTIDYEIVNRDNMYLQALTLCCDKYGTSSNPFSMDCSLPGCTINAAGNNGEITYTVITPVGEIATVSKEVPAEMYAKCTSISAFKYSVKTDTCEKEVSVRRGPIEVFKEISHYINKTLVFTSVEANGYIRESCITSTGCCEIRENKKVEGSPTYAAKVPFTKIAISTESYIHAVDCSLDVILRAGSISRALYGG